MMILIGDFFLFILLVGITVVFPKFGFFFILWLLPFIWMGIIVLVLLAGCYLKRLFYVVGLPIFLLLTFWFIVGFCHFLIQSNQSIWFQKFELISGRKG